MSKEIQFHEKNPAVQSLKEDGWAFVARSDLTGEYGALMDSYDRAQKFERGDYQHKHQQLRIVSIE